MKKYLLFGFDNYPGGGMNDLVANFDTLEELKGKLEGHWPCDEYQLIFTNEGLRQLTLYVEEIIGEDEDIITISDGKRIEELLKWVSKNIND